MDNFTHTIAGLWTGELAHKISGRARLEKREPSEKEIRRRRLWYLWIGVAANNFPDLDLVFYGLLPKPISYLLHHRGHTHTFAIGLLEAALILVIFYCLPGFRDFWKTDRAGRVTTSFVLVLGVGSHIAFDSFNSYGVHPFWPINSRWFYGDIVFIIEPLLWTILGLPFVLGIARPWIRYAWFTFLAVSSIAFFGMKFIPLYSLVTLALFSAVILTAHKVRPRVGAVIASLGCFLVFLGGQSAMSRLAATLIVEETKERFPNEIVVDQALTPLPVNPVCWTFVSVSTSGADYTMRRGALSLWPKFINAKACALPVRRYMNETVAYENERFRIFKEGTFSTVDLANRFDSDCYLNGWMRFVRTPAVNAERANDWRFVAQGEENFSTMKFADFDNASCELEKFPPWVPPRQDLLEAGRRARN